MHVFNYGYAPNWDYIFFANYADRVNDSEIQISPETPDNFPPRVPELPPNIKQVLLKSNLSRIEEFLKTLPLTIKSLNDFGFFTVNQFCQIVLIDLFVFIYQGKEVFSENLHDLNDLTLGEAWTNPENKSKFDKLFVEQIENNCPHLTPEVKKKLLGILNGLNLLFINHKDVFAHQVIDLLEETPRVEPGVAVKALGAMQEKLIKILNDSSTFTLKKLQQIIEFHRAHIRSTQEKVNALHNKRRKGQNISKNEKGITTFHKIEDKSLEFYKLLYSVLQILERHVLKIDKLNFTKESKGLLELQETYVSFSRTVQNVYLQIEEINKNILAKLNDELCIFSYIGFHTPKSIQIVSEIIRFEHRLKQNFWDIFVETMQQLPADADFAESEKRLYGELVINYFDFIFFDLTSFASGEEVLKKSKEFDQFQINISKILPSAYVMYLNNIYNVFYRLPSASAYQEMITRLKEISCFYFNPPSVNYFRHRSSIEKGEIGRKILENIKSDAFDWAHGSLNDFLKGLVAKFQDVKVLPDLDDQNVRDQLLAEKLKERKAASLRAMPDGSDIFLDENEIYHQNLANMAYLENLQYSSLFRYALLNPFFQLCFQNKVATSEDELSWVEEIEKPHQTHFRRRKIVVPAKQRPPLITAATQKNKREGRLSKKREKKTQHPDTLLSILEKKLVAKTMSPLNLVLEEEQLMTLYSHDQIFHLYHVMSIWNVIKNSDTNVPSMRTLAIFLLQHLYLLEEQTLTPVFLEQFEEAHHGLKFLSGGIAFGSAVAEDLDMMTYWSRYLNASLNYYENKKKPLPKGLQLIKEIDEGRHGTIKDALCQYVEETLKDVFQLWGFQSDQSLKKQLAAFLKPETQQKGKGVYSHESLEQIEAYLEKLQLTLNQFQVNKAFFATHSRMYAHLQDALFHLNNFLGSVVLLKTHAQQSHLGFLVRSLYYSASYFAEQTLIAATLYKNFEICTHNLEEYAELLGLDYFFKEPTSMKILSEINILKGGDYPFWIANMREGKFSEGFQVICQAYEESINAFEDMTTSTSRQMFNKLLGFVNHFTIFAQELVRKIESLSADDNKASAFQQLIVA